MRVAPVLGRLGVEHQPIGDAEIAPGRVEIGFLGDRQRLHRRLAEARLDRLHPLRRLLAVQLQQIERRPGQEPRQKIIVGIDQHADLGDAGRYALGKRGGLLDGEMRAGSADRRRSRRSARRRRAPPPALAASRGRRF